MSSAVDAAVGRPEPRDPAGVQPDRTPALPLRGIIRRARPTTCLIHESVWAHLEWAGDLVLEGLGAALFRDVPDLDQKATVTALFVPAMTEIHLQLIDRLRDRFYVAHVVGIVSDLDGRYTHRAIDRGTTCVLNVALPRERQRFVLEPILNGSFLPHGIGPALGVPGPRVGTVPSGLVDAAPEDRELVRLLGGDDSIALIARTLFRSERSLYRQIRRIYDEFGVATREQFRRRAPVAHLDS